MNYKMVFTGRKNVKGISQRSIAIVVTHPHLARYSLGILMLSFRLQLAFCICSFHIRRFNQPDKKYSGKKCYVADVY